MRNTLFALTLALALPAVASDHDRARDAVRSGAIQPLEAVLPAVRARFPGRLVDARLSGDGARYVVRILGADGRVVEAVVDARSGRLLGAR